MAERNFQIGVVQMSCTPEPEQNLERAMAHIRDAAAKGAEVVCLPELFQTQYFCQREDIALFDLAEPIPGPTTTRLGDLARRAEDHDRRVPVRAARSRHLPQYRGGSRVRMESWQGIYRKMHIPDDPLYYEKYYFTPGDLGFKAFETDFGKIGTLVCWDQWYPEGARLTALQGANVLFYPTAIGWHPDEKAQYGEAQYDAWKTIQRAHAIANGVYVAVPNRVGFETGNIRGNVAPGKGLEFWGGSFIADPFGQVIARASHDKEEVLIAEVDLQRIEDVRRNWPFWRDRRVDAYGPITQRFLV